MQWELKNKRTGKLYWLSDKEVDEVTGEEFNPIDKLKKLDMLKRFTVTELKPIAQIHNPLQYEIKKSTKTNKSD